MDGDRVCSHVVIDTCNYLQVGIQLFHLAKLRPSTFRETLARAYYVCARTLLRRILCELSHLITEQPLWNGNSFILTSLIRKLRHSGVPNLLTGIQYTAESLSKQPVWLQSSALPTELREPCVLSCSGMRTWPVLVHLAPRRSFRQGALRFHTIHESSQV